MSSPDEQSSTAQGGVGEDGIGHAVGWDSKLVRPEYD